MINGIPSCLNIINNTRQSARKMKRILLSVQVKFLNLRANKGSSATRRKDITRVRPRRNHRFKKRPESNDHKVNPLIDNESLTVVLEYSFTPMCKSSTKGNEHIKIQLAGVGTPIKESDCRVSILNLARRIAEKIVIKNPSQLNHRIDLKSHSEKTSVNG